jgi:hypothetical protein
VGGWANPPWSRWCTRGWWVREGRISSVCHHELGPRILRLSNRARVVYRPVNDDSCRNRISQSVVWVGDKEKEDPPHLYKYASDGLLRGTREVGPTINGGGEGNSDGVITPDGTGDAVFTIGSPDISDSQPSTIRGEIRTSTVDLVRSVVDYQIRRQADSQLVSSGDTNTSQFTATAPVNPPQVELAYPTQDGLAAVHRRLRRPRVTA